MVSSSSRSVIPRRAVALAAAGALLVTGVGPAGAASIASGDFESGNEGWYSYGPGVESEVVDGELCTTVPAGTANPWDAAVQLDGVGLVVGQDYVLSFDAHGTLSTSITAQVGNWPHSAGFGVAVGPDVDSYEYSFTFDPRGNDGATIELGETATGPLGFQIGGKASDFVFCLDNVSLRDAESELLPQPSFVPDLEGNLTGGWGLTGGISYVITDGVLCIDQPAGSTNPWDVNLTFNGLAIEEGQNYVLSFRASATPGQTPRVLIGENGGGYRTVIDESPVVGTELTAYSFPFTAGLSFPAETSAGGPYEGQVAFQIGKSAAYTFCVTDVSLVTSAAPPPPYEPETGPRVRVNQHGYLPFGPKNATVVTDAAAGLPWQLLDSSDAVVASGTTVPAGVDPSSDLTVHTVDFSDYSTAGTGLTLVADGETSHPFDIDADLYQQLRYDALNYFYLARSGIEIEAGIVGEAYARAAGHVGVAPNKGDLAVTCLTPADEGAGWPYGDWECSDGYALDVVGGWYDAGDHGKYVVNGGIAVAQLLSTYERSLHADSAVEGALGDGTLNLPETGNDVADVLDEARWQLEWMLSMQVPSGEDLAGMVHHKIHDVGWTGLPLMPAADDKERRLHRPSTAATLNLAAAAAQGSRLFKDLDPTFSAELLAAARTAWAAAQANPAIYASPLAGNNGGGPYNDNVVVDEFYWAAAELFVTTGEAQFRDAVLANPEHTADIFGPSGFDWAYTSPLGRITLATVPNALPGVGAVRASVVAGADKYLADQQSEAFGTSYTPAGGVYQWGSNSMVVNNQVVLATAFDLTGEAKYRDAVLEAMDYLLGRNALNNSYVTGYGEAHSKNQHSRWFANQLEPSLPNPPPGSLAGGPNATTGTWDPTMQATFAQGCAPSMCYLDHIQSWASNEITVNWNSAMSWIASFVADQGDGALPEAPIETKAPVVTTHPVSQTASPGTTATFTAAATGQPAPTVTWESRKGSTGAWRAIPGASTTTLKVPVTAAVDKTQYRAVFTNTAGTATSRSATLTVKAAKPDVSKPKVTKQPRSVKVALGKKATFNVTASGHPKPKIQWQQRDKGGTWRNVEGAKSSRLTVKATASSHQRLFRAVLTNSAGKATSKSAKLTVKSAKPKVAKQPRSARAALGSKATFRVVASGFPVPKVQWQQRDKGGKWRNVTGARSSRLTVKATASSHQRQFRAVLKNRHGKVTTKAVELSLKPAKPTITTQPRSIKAAAGQRAHFRVGAKAFPAARVQWEFKRPGNSAWLTVAGATRTTLTVNSRAQLDGFRYRAVVRNKAGAVRSKTVTLTVTGR